mmetsp:Transcript_2291/g.4711  ORF Transcript_2291/g.4711 Transcript_2291/m.4711 type:complete len:86 (-) Transcript_2291:511-768(-)
MGRAPPGGNSKIYRRTVATSRPSTRGMTTEEAANAKKEWEERLRANGINPQTGSTLGKWVDYKWVPVTEEEAVLEERSTQQSTET